MEDRDFIQNCLDGREGAWDDLVDQFSPLIYSLIHKCLGRGGRDYDNQDVDDLLENVFMALIKDDYKLLRDYDPNYRFSTWLGVIVRTQVGRFLRKKRDNVISFEQLAESAGAEDRVDELESHGANPAMLAGEKEELAFVRQALDKLRYKDRLILTLAYFDDKEYKEIASIMDISINSVGAYLYRAKTKLGKILKKMGAQW